MVNNIYNAIARFLKSRYPEYRIYDTYPKQDFRPECFVIRNTGGTIRNRISTKDITRLFDTLTFIVEFYSLDVMKLGEVINDLKIMMNVLDIKEDGYKIRPYNKRSSVNITENRGNFTFNVRINMDITNDSKPRMNELSFKENLIEKTNN